jgi:hypothetical protein
VGLGKNVNGRISTTGNINCGGTLSVSGAASLNSALSVQGTIYTTSLSSTGAITSVSTITAASSISGNQYINGYSILYSTTIGGAYGIFFPLTRWTNNGDVAYIQYTIKVFVNYSGYTETGGRLWGNFTAGVIGATADYVGGPAPMSSQPFYDGGIFYWRFYSTALNNYGGYAYYKFVR